MRGAALSPLPLSLSLHTVVARRLAGLAEGSAQAGDAAHIVSQALRTPPPEEAALVQAAQDMGLSPADTVILSLLRALETHPDLAVQVGALQRGKARHRPSVALLAQVAQGCDPSVDAGAVLRGALQRLGLIEITPNAAPLALSPVALSAPLRAAFGLPSPVPWRAVQGAQAIPASWQTAAQHLVAGWRSGNVAALLRGGLPGDQRLFARALGVALGRGLIEIPAQTDPQAGLGAAFLCAGAVPVETPETVSGARVALTRLEGYRGLRLVLVGQEGGVEAPGWDVMDLSLPPLSGAERAAIWGRAQAVPAALSGLGPHRLAAISARVRLAQDADPEDVQQIRRAAGVEAAPDLEPHGQLVAAEVADAALVASKPLRADLAVLAARCVQRRAHHDDLGPAFQARGPDTGVRALLAGPSGGGKTLACSWLATRLGMPLFRVDLAAIVSKYIGETEENLARVLDRAEASDVVLLFDEADSLFGARTDVKDSSDRFANNQTNYLLSRIERYDGIVLMTTNARDRIDTAFARRIDQVIDVPIPDARERRAIWLAHLGAANGLSGLEMNTLAAGADLAGGHIRSCVGTAEVLARMRCDRATALRITMGDVVQALELEYRKIGRVVPAGILRQ